LLFLQAVNAETASSKETAKQKTKVLMEKTPDNPSDGSRDSGNKAAQKDEAPKVDTVHAVVLDTQKAQFGVSQSPLPPMLPSF